MFCDECKKNPASVHVNTVHNGVHTQKNLCGECAMKYGLMSFMPFSFGDLVPHAVLSEQDQIRCEHCGTTLSEFKREGIVGCQDCYRYLRVGTEPILRRVQKGLLHTGRRPVGYDAGKLPRPSGDSPSVDSAIGDLPCNESAAADSPSQEPVPEATLAPSDPHSLAVQDLQRRMDAAAKEENFELAASLRDELRALQIQKAAGEPRDV